MENMPNKTTYLVLTIVGFVCGLIWGILCISPYNKLKAAIDEGDAETAQANAKKIRIFVIIGIVLNVLILIGQIAGA